MSNKPIKVLLIENSPEVVDLIGKLLSKEKNFSFDIEFVDRLQSGVERLSKGGIDVVLLDLFLPDSHGFEVFNRVHSRAPAIPIVILTSFDDQNLAVETIRKGAQDYLIKAEINDGKTLSRVIRYTIERKRLEEILNEIKKENKKLSAKAQELEQQNRELRKRIRNQ